VPPAPVVSYAESGLLDAASCDDCHGGLGRCFGSAIRRQAGRVTHDRELDTLQLPAGCRFGHRRLGLAHHPGAQSGAGRALVARYLLGSRARSSQAEFVIPRPPCACRPVVERFESWGQTSARRRGVFSLARRPAPRGTKRRTLARRLQRRFGQDTVCRISREPARWSMPSISCAPKLRASTKSPPQVGVLGWGDPAGPVAAAKLGPGMVSGSCGTRWMPEAFAYYVTAGTARN